MLVYHRTHHSESILHDGFRDSSGTYLTHEVWSGVWLADRPLDENEGADGDVVLELDVPEPLFIECEWVEEGKTCREALIPAERLNAYSETARLLSEEEIDELTSARWDSFRVPE